MRIEWIHVISTVQRKLYLRFTTLYVILQYSPLVEEDHTIGFAYNDAKPNDKHSSNTGYDITSDVIILHNHEPGWNAGAPCFAS